jgi:hypothetical protein
MIEVPIRMLPFLALACALIAPPAKGQAAPDLVSLTRAATTGGELAPHDVVNWAAAVIGTELPQAGAVRQPRSAFWVAGGFGFASRGPAAHVSGTYRSGGNLFSARGAGTIAVFGDELWDVGILYGRSLLAGVVHASAAAGGGLVGGMTREGVHDDPRPLQRTFGVPIEVQLFFRPLPVLGIGLYGFSNVNREESFTGVTAAVQLGRLR